MNSTTSWPDQSMKSIIDGGKLELSELLSSNIAHTEAELQLLFDGRLVLTSTPMKPKRCIEDNQGNQSGASGKHM